LSFEADKAGLTNVPSRRLQGSNAEEKIALRMAAVADTAAAQAVARDLLERVIQAQTAPEPLTPGPVAAPAEAKRLQGDNAM
jgi:hypothetical protein